MVAFPHVGFNRELVYIFKQNNYIHMLRGLILGHMNAITYNIRKIIFNLNGKFKLKLPSTNGQNK